MRINSLFNRIIVFITLLLIQQLNAQAPEKMTYQAVVRNSSNQLITDAVVGIHISIIQTHETGPTVYEETHQPTTNSNGLLSIVIGEGTVLSGSLSIINWSNGPWFINIQVDPEGGTDYTISSTNQLLSVPYALHAKTADHLTETTGWSMSGNSGTNPNTDFIGTTDSQPIVFRVNNEEKMRLGNRGNLKFSGTGNSIFIGRGAGANDDLSDNHNIFIGDSAGVYNTIGYGNVAMGKYSLTHNSAGVWNVAVGNHSLTSNIDGVCNTAIGESALNFNKSGTHNTAGGGGAMNLNTSGSNNTALGFVALQQNKTGNANTAIGLNALFYNVSGNANTAIGCYSGASSSATNTTAIGYNAIPTASNTIRLGDNSITQIGGIVGWSNLSDGRFKVNVKENVPGLEFIQLLRPITYNWDMDAIDNFYNKSNTVKSQEQLKARQEKESKAFTGFIAQEVEKAASACNYDFSGIIKPANEHSQYNLSYSEFVVPLVKAVQELYQQNQQMKQEYTQQIQKLKTEIEQLKSKK